MSLNLSKIILLFFCTLLSWANTDLYASPEDDLANMLMQDAQNDAEKIYQLGVKFRSKEILQEYPFF